MSLASSDLAAVPWPVLVVGAWVITVMVVAALIYAISKAAINKSDAASLPQVLAALTPFLGGMSAVFTRQLRPPAEATPISLADRASGPTAASHTEENDNADRPEAVQ
jgi:hypothetical protein